MSSENKIVQSQTILLYKLFITTLMTDFDIGQKFSDLFL